jgi:hypothetical protein
MKALPGSLAVSALACCLGLAASACSGTTPEKPTTETSKAALTSGDSVAALAGTWGFVLDASDVAAKVRADCAGRFAADATKRDACYDEVRTEGATEKIRFSRDAAGRSLWTSFGQKGDKTELFLEIPLELSAESPRSVLGKVAGTPRGLQAEDATPHLPPGTIMHFEIVDDQTIAMSDPKKGRLVFHKE